MTPQRLKEIQQTLFDLSLYTGKVDGIFGPLTTEAIKRYQNLHGLEATGSINSALSRMIQPVLIRERLNDAPPTVTTPRYPHDDTASLFAFYGQAGDESQLIPIGLPYTMRLAWEPETEITKARFHTKCAFSFRAFFKDILHHYGDTRIRETGLDMFGGSFNNRAIRGGTRPSTHAFGAAVDLNPAANQLRWNRSRAQFAKPEFKALIEIAHANDLTSLGDKRDFDWMHFQAAWVN